MAKDVEEVFRDALALPLDSRIALADSLIESMEIESDPDAEDLWKAEIQRRMAESDSGAPQIAWPEFRDRLFHSALLF